MVIVMTDKQKRQARKRAQQEQNKIAKVCIGLIVVVFMITMTVQIQGVYNKKLEYMEKQAQLEELLKNEQQRKEDLEEYKIYIESQEYIEDVAKSKLGLLYENEIIFRESND